MGENAADSVLSGKFQKCGNILRVNIPGLSAPGITGEKLEGIGIYFCGIDVRVFVCRLRGAERGLGIY